MSTTDSSGTWRPACAPSTISKIRFAISVEPEGWVLLGHQERVAAHARAPALGSSDELEEARRVGAGEQDREPRDDQRDEHADPDEVQGDEVRDREDPLDERPPARDSVLRI